MRVRRALALALIVTGMAAALYPPLLLPRAAAAASLSFAVTSTADAADASPGDGICATSAGDCTLRAAVEEGDAQPAGSTITIDVPAGTYSLTLGVLALTANTITINGAMSSTTIIDAGGLSGVFAVSIGVSATLVGLTISNGVAATGGGINNGGTLSLENIAVLNNTTTSAVETNGGDGGGIWNSGTLTIDNSLISGNSTATGGFGSANPAGNGGNGGGLWSSGALTLTASTISNNAAGSGGSAPNDVPGNGGDGGGIYVEGGTVTISGSMVTNNSTGSGGNGEENTLAGNGGDGGGLWSGSTVNLTNSTISGNYTGRGGGLGAGGVGGSGGGIWNSGTFSATGSTITGNSTGSGSTVSNSAPGKGGGVWNSGTFTANNSTVGGNTASGGGVGTAGGDGGGIYGSAGTVNLTDSTISGNTAGTGGNGGLGGFDAHYGLPGGPGGNGGGIWNGATLNVDTSTFSGNSGGTGGLGGCGPVTCAGSAAGGNGGAVWNSGSAQVINSTLSGNSGGPGGASNCGYGQCGSAGVAGIGGGLFESGGTATIGYATVAANEDGLVNMGGTITLTGSIIAGNQTGPNCSGTISEVAGYNLDSGTTCALSEPTDLTATDPLLAPLAANGGPTQTVALLAGSPAIDHGGSAVNGCPATDQRGVARPQGAACDIGAYESNGTVHALSGHVRYYGSGSPVAAVAVDLTGATPQVMNTDATGAFTFAGLGETDWTLTPQSQTAASAAITPLDAVFVLQAVVGSRQLNVQQTVACDTSGDGSLTPLDAVYILQYVVGSIQSFPATQPCGSLWAFLPTPASTVMNEQLINPGIVQGTCQHGAMVFPPLMSDATGQDFAAVVVGDCSGDWQPAIAAAPLSELAGEAQVRFARPHRGRGGRVRFPLLVESGEPFQALDSRISYDAGRLQLVAVRRMNAAGNALVEYNANVPGQVRIALASAQPIVSAGGPVLALDFEAQRSGRFAPPHALSASVAGQSAGSR